MQERTSLFFQSFQTYAIENNFIFSEFSNLCNRKQLYFFDVFNLRGLYFLKIHGVFKYSYRDRKSRASLRLSYKYFCSTVLSQLLENPLEGWGQFVFLGCFVLQLLFIARAGQWKGRRGGKVCRDKPRAAAGNGFCGSSGLLNDTTNTISAEGIHWLHYITFIDFKTTDYTFRHFLVGSALFMSSARVFSGIWLVTLLSSYGLL